MAKEKVLIAVKTYPVISESYTELACTAGFREDGSWIRLYPIPFRLLGKDGVGGSIPLGSTILSFQIN